MDHDQRFKTLLRAFFADFMRLFFADWAERLDLSAIDWLDKEVFPIRPKGNVILWTWWPKSASKTRTDRCPNLWSWFTLRSKPLIAPRHFFGAEFRRELDGCRALELVSRNRQDLLAFHLLFSSLPLSFLLRLFSLSKH
ncbi:MAG: hypothetical protein ACK4RK_07215 [Gemmataceae bacterium]